ncbi:MAG: cellulase family glycosylhydrolase [Clostridia bacterium]|nr:cellulase family glycosylhydrolase [Clostridia bacterium]
MIQEKFSKHLVSGYLRADGTKIVNGNGQEILLSGFGIGGWMVNEGYMWGIHTRQYSSPRGLEFLVRELCGSAYADKFWKQFRHNFITHQDIKEISRLGHTCIRVPLHWKFFMENEPEIIWLNEGFELLDNLLDWCEQERVYVILDIHASHGGHTGSNIDDSVDNFARMFNDQMSWDRTILLWKTIAQRYESRWIVGAYDLLNEPIRNDEPPHWPDQGNLLPKLKQFYRECTAAIRSVDKKHMLMYEGHNWASKPDIFDEVFDSNMCISPHRYWLNPEPQSYEGFLKVSRQLNVPLWVGESGENTNEWYAAMFPLTASLGIGYCFWPWKRMSRADSCPAVIKMPEGWQQVIEYTIGGVRPTYEHAQQMFDQLLENIKFENCKLQPSVTDYMFRRPGSKIKGQDHDKLGGEGKDYSNVSIYKLHPTAPVGKYHRNHFEWEDQTFDILQGGFANYTFFGLDKGAELTLEVKAKADAKLRVVQQGKQIAEFTADKCDEIKQYKTALLCADSEDTVTVICDEGTVNLVALAID